ncbi:hypothetical protein Hanom_Chr06g00548071 [Helianthus anomalus]
MKLWCYNSDTSKTLIVYKDDTLNFQILDCVWIVNTSRKDIQTLFNNMIFYEDNNVVQALKFKKVVRICYYYGLNSGGVWTSAHKKILGRPERIEDQRLQAES